MKYKFIKDIDNSITTIELTTDNGKKYFIPINEANTDYQQYLEWTKASPMNVAEEVE